MMATSSMPESESDAAARGSGERQPETGRPTAQCDALRVLPRGCRVQSSRAGGAVRTGPQGPRPFSRFRICLSGNPAPPQDGVGPGAQAAPGTAPSHQAPRPSLSAPSAGDPGEGERTTDPGGLRAVPLGPHPRGRGVRRAEPLCPPWVGG